MKKLCMIFIILFLAGCSVDNNDNTEKTVNDTSYVTTSIKKTDSTEQVTKEEPTESTVIVETTHKRQVRTVSDYEPDETGKVYVIMFHDFVSEYNPDSDNAYRMKLLEFRALLQRLYDMHFRPVSMTDFINNDINIPKGAIPVIFTFDDGWSGQFNLIKENDKLVVNPESAVGVMEEFSLNHEDFESNGLFFIYLNYFGLFSGEGTMEERLRYLVDNGYELGNHTFMHNNLRNLDKEEIEESIGRNQYELMNYLKDYDMKFFSPPGGGFPKKEYMDVLYKGNYGNIDYNHIASFKAGWQPCYSSGHIKFDYRFVERIRSPGEKPVEGDANWWLDRIDYRTLYISDGESDIITIKERNLRNIDFNKIRNKEIRIVKSENIGDKDREVIIKKNIDNMLLTIMKSTPLSSNPYDYINASKHETEYIKSTGITGKEYLASLADKEKNDLRQYIIKILLELFLTE
jgi:peptidoglycan/xylan/chitin deacetylase (PgdA/CDA1 family)